MIPFYLCIYDEYGEIIFATLRTWPFYVNEYTYCWERVPFTDEIIVYIREG